jgi:DNA-binding NtrC family response regulator
MRSLEMYDWPGNVRELENVLTRALTLARGDILTREDLAASFGSMKSGARGPDQIEALKEAEKKHIEKALAATDWNITQTAKVLQISPTTLRKKIGDFGLKKPR